MIFNIYRYYRDITRYYLYIYTPVAGVEGAGAAGQGGQLAGALVQVELDSLPPEAGQGLLLQVAQLVGLGTGW